MREKAGAPEFRVRCMYCRGKGMIGADCAERRDAPGAAIPGATQQVFEFADLVAAVNIARGFVVFDGDVK